MLTWEVVWGLETIERERMNRPIFAGKRGAFTIGPLVAFTSLSLNFPIWKLGLIIAHVTTRIQCKDVCTYST